MKLSRKFMMAGAALSLSLGTVALTGVGIASAKGPKQATGTVSCTGAKGLVSFKPALTTKGPPYVSEKASVKVTFSGCTGSVTSPKSGSIKATLSSISTDECPPPASGDSGGSLTVKWSPTTIAPSAVGFSSKESTTNGNGDFGFVYPAPGGTSSVAGSYEGTDSGASSSASVFSNVTETTLLNDCSSKKGLKKLTITTGSISLG